METWRKSIFTFAMWLLQEYIIPQHSCFDPLENGTVCAEDLPQFIRKVYYVYRHPRSRLPF